jgi:hypothetical protein
VAGIALQPHRPHLLHGLLQAVGLVDAAHLQPEGDVVDHVQPGHQGMLLEHHAAVGARPLDMAAVDEDVPLAGRHEAGDGGQQVVLPQPEAPTATTNSPRSKFRSTADSASTSPPGHRHR